MLQPIQLRTLQEVLASGSFAEAGFRLGFTPSAVSQQMSALERATGLKLFERGPRSIRPTVAAATLGSRAEVLLGQLDVLEREVRAMAAGEQGVVRVGSFPTASAGLLPATLARLAGRRAGIDVVLDEAEPGELVPRLSNGSLDLIVVYEYDTVPNFWPAELVRVALLRESLVLLADAHYSPATTRLAEVADATWVASRENTAGARSLERLCASAGFAPRVSYRSNDYNVVRGLVGAGLGVALVPALAHVDDPLIAAAEVQADGAGRSVFVLYRDEDVNPLLKVVVNALGKSAQLRARGDRWVRVAAAIRNPGTKQASNTSPRTRRAE